MARLRLLFAFFATVPFVLNANHIYFRVAVNDNVASNFVLDTGAGASVIDKHHAEQLHLRSFGHGEAHGTGEKTVPIELIMKPHVSFAGVDVSLNYLAVVPLTAISLRDGRDMQGIIGYDVLRDRVATIDYVQRLVRFDDAQTFLAPDGAVAVPITFVKKTPVMNGAITLLDGQTIPVRILIDTGARGAIRLNTTFVQKYRLDRAIGPGIEGQLGIGVGGTTHEKVRRLRSVSFGGFVLDSPVVSISGAKSGTDAETAFDAQIGGEILRRFTVTVDYPHNRLLFVKNSAFSDPFVYDMTGLTLSATTLQFNRFMIVNVISGSPASEAQIDIGDEILAIDGEGVSKMTLDSIRRLFQREGTHRLTILRRGDRIDKTVTARPLV